MRVTMIVGLRDGEHGHECECECECEARKNDERPDHMRLTVMES
jgi:hypothetical protein